MKALVLDFDGVLFDSAQESFAVAYRSYLALRPESSLATADRQQVFGEFLTLMPLGNRAEDYGAVMAAIEQGRALADQTAYDRFRAEQDSDWLAEYHARFYETRHALSAKAPEKWHALMRPYDAFVSILVQHAGQCDYAIATSKDRRSVDILLAAHDMSGLFSEDRIMDKESGPDKSAHLQRLQAILGHPFEDLTFVDDKINHLDKVSPLGVRCALAGWGYNARREQELADRRGYLVCSLDDAERKLFGE